MSIIDNENELKKVIDEIVLKDNHIQQLCKLPILRKTHNPIPKSQQVTDYT